MATSRTGRQPCVFRAQPGWGMREPLDVADPQSKVTLELRLHVADGAGPLDRGVTLQERMPNRCDCLHRSASCDDDEQRRDADAHGA